MKRIKIGDKWIGDDEPCMIVAEVSCNHLQKKEYALRLIEEAKTAGADAVKFQTYTPDTITLNCDNEYFRIKGTLWEGRTLYDLYKEAHTPWDWFPELKDAVKQQGMEFFSTPLDETSVDFLEKLGVPAYKIASFEINHIPLLEYVAKTKKPVILSSGVATLEDLQLAVETIKKQGNDQIVILKCTSSYPTPLNEMNIATMTDISKKFNVITGFSDHSLGITAPIISIALGAKLIEKHFILDRKQGGPDAEFSIEPNEFKQLVEAVRNAEQAIGKTTYSLGEKTANHRFFMRSIFAAKDIKNGEVFTKENIRVVRPNAGIHPRYYSGLLGKTSKKSFKKGDPIDKSVIE